MTAPYCLLKTIKNTFQRLYLYNALRVNCLYTYYNNKTVYIVLVVCIIYTVQHDFRFRRRKPYSLYVINHYKLLQYRDIVVEKDVMQYNKIYYTTLRRRY